ncbi:MAG: ATP-binding protein [Methanomassiliicoccales archaeon]|nr:ATP-binding protein [Methanomassiliicoccales archaeon]
MVIFAIDLVTPLGLGVSMLYIAPVLIVSRLGRLRPLLAVCVLSSSMVITAFFFKSATFPNAVLIAEVNRAVILGAIWVTAELSYTAERASARLLETKSELLRTSEDLRGRVEVRSRKLREVVAQLTQAKAELEQRVAERTADLTNANAALSEQRERLAITLASMGDGVIATDDAKRVTLMNGVAESLTGWKAEEAMGVDIAEVLVLVDSRRRDKVANPMVEVLASGQNVELASDVLLLARDGREVPIADSAAPVRDGGGAVVGTVFVFRDMTQQLRRNEEMERASRLDSIGLLAGGIAHDFNNLLTVIEGNLALSRLAGHPARAQERISEAERAAERARSLTKQLLTFSEGGEPVAEAIDTAALLKEVCALALSGSNVKCKVGVEPGLLPILGDGGQVAQALSNVLINAREAMPGGGVVMIEAANLTAGPGAQALLPEGRYVKLSFRDRGGGIPKDALPRVFNPYFSTKGEGRGLGLAVSHSIVTRHGGRIAIESSVGAGTEVTITLPAADGAPEVKGAPEMFPAAERRRILWMDDEEMILDMGGEMLTVLGYEVRTAPDGAEAVRIYEDSRRSGAPFDAVILDLMVQGGTGGRETIEMLRAIDPEVRAIVCSGYCNDPVMSRHAEYGFAAALPKPFRMEELSKVIHETVERRAG